ncbi:uncharacterized protein LOC126264709 [Aethina tumida]|uniref:uncharacterized protein LOC126264709 n=1 Tax=Aethina tumida TaxID=116153 RepID=UPI002147FCD2|nr:uncharacterized protein LOC126264709 [Aethina tumida]
MELGRPKRIIADRGTAFVASKFREFLNDNSVELHLIATGVPRGNGQVERVMRSLFNAMRAVLNEKDENKWTKVLPDIEDDFNVTVNKSTGFAPWILMFGENRRLRATNELLNGVPIQTSDVDAEILRQQAHSRVCEVTSRTITNFNKKRVPAIPYAVGDKVVIENSQLSNGGKLKPKYHGPFEVTHCLPNERYALRRIGSRGRTTTAAHEQLRTWPDTEIL